MALPSDSAPRECVLRRGDHDRRPVTMNQGSVSLPKGQHPRAQTKEEGDLPGPAISGC